MALNENHLKRQTERLKTLPRGEERPWGTDKSPGLRDELFRALWSASSTDQHASEIIEYIIATAKFAPTAAELYELAHAQAEQVRNSKAWELPDWGTPVLCGRCQGLGNILEDGVYVRCTCENGQEYSQVLLDLANNPTKPRSARIVSEADLEEARQVVAKAIAARAMAEPKVVKV